MKRPISGCRWSSSSSSWSSSRSAFDRRPTVDPSQLIGKPLPDFALPPAMAGRPGLASADLPPGQPRLLNVFASWCVPCTAEAPQLMELKRRGIPIDGIADPRPAGGSGRLPLPMATPSRTIGADADRRVQFALGSSGVPETFVVDGQGVIRHQHIGEISAADVPRDRRRLSRGGAMRRLLLVLALLARRAGACRFAAAAGPLREHPAPRSGAGARRPRR